MKKIAIMTEWADYGNIRTLMKTRTGENALSKALRVKFCFDAAKGIQYIHGNGILHRNIKPENFLVVSLQVSGTINAKLADFGSSRSINMMMTNMTFTKGIGSPKYMAPEILNREHYKDGADIFSLAITMYEIFSWEDAYPESQFNFPWKIAEFVAAGNRLKQTDELTDEEFALIQRCWEQDPKERMKIEEIVQTLKEMNTIVKKVELNEDGTVKIIEEKDYEDFEEEDKYEEVKRRDSVYREKRMNDNQLQDPNDFH